MNDFFINNLHGAGGPSIFSRRLFDEFTKNGISYNERSKNRLSIISGEPIVGSRNVLRLDGLYFQKDHPENLKIFDCYKQFEHVVFQGEFCRNQYESFTGIKKSNTVICNGVPESFFKRGYDLIPKDRPRVVASASWRRHKRLEEIVGAFKSKKLKDVELWVLGGQSFKGQTTPNIKLIQTVSPEELPVIYQSCDAMIHIAWLDWCPNSVVEGLASGLPVLCSSNGGTKEIVKDDGIVMQIEEDYNIGEELDLYQPPNVDSEIIADSVLQIINMNKSIDRCDLKIANVAKKYKKALSIPNESVN